MEGEGIMFVVGKKYKSNAHFNPATCKMVSEGRHPYAFLVYEDGSAAAVKIKDSSSWTEYREPVKLIRWTYVYETYGSFEIDSDQYYTREEAIEHCEYHDRVLVDTIEIKWERK